MHDTIIKISQNKKQKLIDWLTLSNSAEIWEYSPMNQICAWEDEPKSNINQLEEWRNNLSAQITVQEQQLKTLFGNPTITTSKVLEIFYYLYIELCKFLNNGNLIQYFLNYSKGIKDIRSLMWKKWLTCVFSNILEDWKIFRSTWSTRHTWIQVEFQNLDSSYKVRKWMYRIQV